MGGERRGGEGGVGEQGEPAATAASNKVSMPVVSMLVVGKRGGGDGVQGVVSEMGDAQRDGGCWRNKWMGARWLVDVCMWRVEGGEGEGEEGMVGGGGSRGRVGTPCLPRVPGYAFASVPTRALKSPRTMLLPGMLRRTESRWL